MPAIFHNHIGVFMPTYKSALHFIFRNIAGDHNAVEDFMQTFCAASNVECSKVGLEPEAAFFEACKNVLRPSDFELIYREMADILDIQLPTTEA